MSLHHEYRLIVDERESEAGHWLTAEIENDDGGLVGKATAPVVDGATFNIRAAVIRAAVEDGLRTEDA